MQPGAAGEGDAVKFHKWKFVEPGTIPVGAEVVTDPVKVAWAKSIYAALVAPLALSDADYLRYIAEHGGGQKSPLSVVERQARLADRDGSRRSVAEEGPTETRTVLVRYLVEA